MATPSATTEGCWAAREISHADVASSATPRASRASPEQRGKGELPARRPGQPEHAADRRHPPLVGEALLCTGCICAGHLARRVNYVGHAATSTRVRFDHPIGESKQGWAVSDHDNGAPPSQSHHSVEHVRLRLAVEVGGGLVEEE